MAEEKKFTCCICGKEFTGWGNNPWPVSDKEGDRCCDDCNWNHVIPARIADLKKRNNKEAK